MAKYDEAVFRRLRRMEGQVRGVLKMMDEGKGCKDIVSQLTAVRSAADKALAYIVAVNLEQCILEEQDQGKNTGNLVKEAMHLLVKSR